MACRPGSCVPLSPLAPQHAVTDTMPAAVQPALQVVVDEERACPHCHLRLGGKVFVVLQPGMLPAAEPSSSSASGSAAGAAAAVATAAAADRGGEGGKDRKSVV